MGRRRETTPPARRPRRSGRRAPSSASSPSTRRFDEERSSRSRRDEPPSDKHRRHVRPKVRAPRRRSDSSSTKEGSRAAGDDERPASRETPRRAGGSHASREGDDAPPPAPSNHDGDEVARAPAPAAARADDEESVSVASGGSQLSAPSAPPAVKMPEVVQHVVQPVDRGSWMRYSSLPAGYEGDPGAHGVPMYGPPPWCRPRPQGPVPWGPHGPPPPGWGRHSAPPGFGPRPGGLRPGGPRLGGPRLGGPRLPNGRLMYRPAGHPMGHPLGHPVGPPSWYGHGPRLQVHQGAFERPPVWRRSSPLLGAAPGLLDLDPRWNEDPPSRNWSGRHPEPPASAAPPADVQRGWYQRESEPGATEDEDEDEDEDLEHGGEELAEDAGQDLEEVEEGHAEAAGQDVEHAGRGLAEDADGYLKPTEDLAQDHQAEDVPAEDAEPTSEAAEAAPRLPSLLHLVLPSTPPAQASSSSPLGAFGKGDYRVQGKDGLHPRIARPSASSASPVAPGAEPCGPWDWLQPMRTQAMKRPRPGPYSYPCQDPEQDFTQDVLPSGFGERQPPEDGVEVGRGSPGHSGPMSPLGCVLVRGGDDGGYERRSIVFHPVEFRGSHDADGGPHDSLSRKVDDGADLRESLMMRLDGAVVSPATEMESAELDLRETLSRTAGLDVDLRGGLFRGPGLDVNHRFVPPPEDVDLRVNLDRFKQDVDLRDTLNRKMIDPGDLRNTLERKRAPSEAALVGRAAGPHREASLSPNKADLRAELLRRRGMLAEFLGEWEEVIADAQALASCADQATYGKPPEVLDDGEEDLNLSVDKFDAVALGQRESAGAAPAPLLAQPVNVDLFPLRKRARDFFDEPELEESEIPKSSFALGVVETFLASMRQEQESIAEEPPVRCLVPEVKRRKCDPPEVGIKKRLRGKKNIATYVFTKARKRQNSRAKPELFKAKTNLLRASKANHKKGLKLKETSLSVKEEPLVYYDQGSASQGSHDSTHKDKDVNVAPALKLSIPEEELQYHKKEQEVSHVVKEGEYSDVLKSDSHESVQISFKKSKVSPESDDDKPLMTRLRRRTNLFKKKKI